MARTHAERPPVGRGAGASRVANALGIAVAAVAGAVAIAFAQPLWQPAAQPGAHGLVALVGAPGRAQLDLLAEPAGPAGAWSVSELALPTADAAWLSVSRDGRLAVTLGTGTLAVSGPLQVERDPVWQTVTPRSVDGEPDVGPLTFATWSPDGTRLAALAAGGTHGPYLVVVEAAGGDALVLPVRGPAAPGPPAWLDQSRVAVLVLEASGQAAAIALDVTDGSSTPLAGAPTDVTVSADGSAIAMVVSGSLRAGPAAAFITSGALPRVIEPAGDGSYGALALSADGARLAYVRLDGAGRAASIGLRRWDGARWRGEDDLPVPGDAQGAVVGWLP